MALVFPDGCRVSGAVMVSVAPAKANAPLPGGQQLRRQSTASRYQGLPEATQALALGYRSFRRPRDRYAVPAALLVCALLQLLVGAPYAASDRAASGSPWSTALRGLIAGILMYFVLGPMYLVTAPAFVRGGFHPRFLLSFPITLGVSVGVAFLPVDASTPGVVAIGLLTFVLTYVLLALLLSAPFYATDEHKALHHSFGPPVVAINTLFFGLITAYVTLTRTYSSPLVGLLLPVGSAVTRVLGMHALVRSCHTFYYVPKREFLTQLATSAQRPSNAVPPILGDIEAIYGYFASFFTLIIGNAASVSTLVEVMLSLAPLHGCSVWPSRRCWRCWPARA
jgi:hypothetical protein